MPGDRREKKMGYPQAVDASASIARSNLVNKGLLSSNHLSALHDTNLYFATPSSTTETATMLPTDSHALAFQIY